MLNNIIDMNAMLLNLIAFREYFVKGIIPVGYLILIIQCWAVLRHKLPNLNKLFNFYRIIFTSYVCLSSIIFLFDQKWSHFNISIVVVFAINNVMKIFREPFDIPDISLKEVNFSKHRNGNIKLGTIFNNKQIVGTFKLGIEDIKRHILIYGQTGTGKTTFIKNLLYNFSRKYPKIPFILFEFKEEYNDLPDLIENVEIISPGRNFFFNLFDHDIFSGQNYVEILFDSLKSCQILEDNADFSPQMEKILVDVLKLVCKNKKQQSWKYFFEQLDFYCRLNENNIPMIKQTMISITNRLRRYYEGSLSKVFKFSTQANKISELLEKNCVVDLSSILRFGGSKEDVIFFANMILKWIWEKNMSKKSTNQLEHITIFEDASYMASKKILETSKLSTYLEDIALLLRGKGEALITLTTTLDISKNIILNSGTKFFFKFNEKTEDLIHYIGIQEADDLRINELTTGYCITKIDSIPDPFILRCNKTIRYFKTRKKTKNTRVRKKSKISSKKGTTGKIIAPNITTKKKISIKKSKKRKNKKSNKPKHNITTELKNKNIKKDLESNPQPDESSKQSKNIKIKETINPNVLHSLKNQLSKVEEMYLIENYKFCIKESLSIYVNLSQMLYLGEKFERIEEIVAFEENIVIPDEFFSAFTHKFQEIKFNLERNRDIPESALKSIKYMKKIFIYFQDKFKIAIKRKEITKKINKTEKVPEEKIISNPDSHLYLKIIHYDKDKKPKIFFELGNMQQICIENNFSELLDYNSPDSSEISDEKAIITQNFKIDSKWSQNKVEFLKILIILDTTVINIPIGQKIQKIQETLENLIHTIKKEKKNFYAFYLSDVEKRQKFKQQLIEQSFILKNLIKKCYEEINKISEDLIKSNHFDQNQGIEQLEMVIQELMVFENSSSIQ
jgi:uncharacterized protein DUF87